MIQEELYTSKIKNTSKKLHNTKSHPTAIYAPCWLTQIPNKKLSFAAKMLYARLSLLSNEKDSFPRSCTQLAVDIGTSQRSVERHLQELRGCGLIGTYRIEEGGVNYFEFYYHEWMGEDNSALPQHKGAI